MIEKILFAAVAASVFSSIACNGDSKYECIERTQKEVPNFMREGTHTAVDYVLLHEGHKIYASCDTADLSNLDPSATCGFRPSQKVRMCLTDGQHGERNVPTQRLKV